MLRLPKTFRLDPVWTFVRFILCVGPALLFSLPVLRFSQPAGLEYSLNATAEVAEWEADFHRVQATFLLGTIAVGVLMFSGFQLAARNPRYRPEMQHWLSLHGWNGATSRTPFPGDVPISELLCIAAATIGCGLFEPTGFALIPWCWLATRLLLQIEWFLKQNRRYTGLCWIMLGAAFLGIDRLWLALPLLIVVGVVARRLAEESQKALSNELMMTDLDKSWRDTTLFGMPLMKQRPQTSMFPHWQLRPGIFDNRPSWITAVSFSTVLAWFTVCLLTKTASLLQEGVLRDETQQMENASEMATVCIIVLALLSGLVRFFRSFAAVWHPRLGPVSRMILLRPFVPSWDHVLLPLLIAMIAAVGLILVPGEFWAFKIAAMVFMANLILQRSGPATDEWQMTSDATLSSMLLSNPNSSHR